MRCGIENVLLFKEQHDDSREVEGEVGASLVEEGRRDCCSSVSGSGLYESLPTSTSAWSFIFRAETMVLLKSVKSRYQMLHLYGIDCT
jgi:hypothetical protein